ncbi:MAG: trypsin-like peptidase domain-containing protein [Candidatus Woesearchaeota archaeon]
MEIKVGRQMLFNIIIAVILVGFITFSLLYINSMKKDFESRNQDLQNEITVTRSVLSDIMINLTTEVVEQKILFNSMMSSLQEEDKKNLDTLKELIDNLEQQSNLQLSELKDDITNIQVSSADFTAIIPDVIGSIVSVLTNVGQGSGAFIRDGGFIVTNYHVIKDASNVRVYTYNEKTYNAIVVGAEVSSDIAVLKIDKDFDHLDFGDSDDLQAGQKVIALGNPSGLDFTVTEGIISSPSRDIGGQTFIQIDVPINPGNSGGPLVNLHKEIVGINNFKIGGGFESLGFAIPSNKVDEVVDEIIRRYEDLLASQVT